MQTNKKIGASLALLMIASIFAMAFVLADKNNSEKGGSTKSSLSSDEIEVIEVNHASIKGNNGNNGNDDKTLEEVDEDNQTTNSAYWLAQVTQADGYAIKSDGSDVALFTGMWVIKDVIETNKDLENLTSNIKKSQFGSISLGFGNEKAKYKIEGTNDGSGTGTYTYNIIDKNSVKCEEEENETNCQGTEEKIIGTLAIIPKNYTHATMWTGTIVLNEGEYQGNWNINAVAKTTIVKPKVKKLSAWNIFAWKGKKEANLKEKVQDKILEKNNLKEKFQEAKANTKTIKEQNKQLKEKPKKSNISEED